MQYEPIVPPDQALIEAGEFAFGLFRTYCPAVKDFLRDAEAIARARVHILIQGETGTGKELVAQAIHNARPADQRGPFRTINLAGRPSHQVPYELFGHARGAYTNSGPARKGLLELARGGTAFLDEIGDMPYDAQGSLLRAWQQGEIEVIQGQVVRLRARLLAATHRDLAALSTGEDPRFRQDLYARMATVRIELPPLRERKEDIGPCFCGFYMEALAQLGHEARPVPEEVLARLLERPWVMNFRELKGVAWDAARHGFAAALAQKETPPAPEAAPGAHLRAGAGKGLTTVVLEHVVETHKECGEDAHRTARTLHCNTRTVQRYLKQARG